MPAYKDEKTGKWFAKFYYTNWQGIKKQKWKRGFATKMYRPPKVRPKNLTIGGRYFYG